MLTPHSSSKSTKRLRTREYSAMLGVSVILIVLPCRTLITVLLWGTTPSLTLLAGLSTLISYPSFGLGSVTIACELMQTTYSLAPKTSYSRFVHTHCVPQPPPSSYLVSPPQGDLSECSSQLEFSYGIGIAPDSIDAKVTPVQLVHTQGVSNAAPPHPPCRPSWLASPCFARMWLKCGRLESRAKAMVEFPVTPALWPPPLGRETRHPPVNLRWRNSHSPDSLTSGPACTDPFAE